MFNCVIIIFEIWHGFFREEAEAEYDGMEIVRMRARLTKSAGAACAMHRNRCSPQPHDYTDNYSRMGVRSAGLLVCSAGAVREKGPRNRVVCPVAPAHVESSTHHKLWCDWALFGASSVRVKCFRADKEKYLRDFIETRRNGKMPISKMENAAGTLGPDRCRSKLPSFWRRI